MAFFHILFLQRLIFRRANVIHSMSFTGASVTQVLQALSLKQRYLACEMTFTGFLWYEATFLLNKCIWVNVSNPAILKALGKNRSKGFLRCLVGWSDCNKTEGNKVQRTIPSPISIVNILRMCHFQDKSLGEPTKMMVKWRFVFLGDLLSPLEDSQMDAEDMVFLCFQS